MKKNVFSCTPRKFQEIKPRNLCRGQTLPELANLTGWSLFSLLMASESPYILYSARYFCWCRIHTSNFYWYYKCPKTALNYSFSQHPLTHCSSQNFYKQCPNYRSVYLLEENGEGRDAGAIAHSSQGQYIWYFPCFKVYTPQCQSGFARATKTPK